MSVQEPPYKISSPEEALASLRNITKLIDKLRLHLNKLHERNQTMCNYMVAQLQNFKLQMQPQEVPVSYLSLFKVTSQNIFVSSDLAPDIDPFQGITRVFSKMLHEMNKTMYNYMATQLQNFKLQMKYMVDGSGTP